MLKDHEEMFEMVVNELEDRVVETRFDPDEEKRLVVAIDDILTTIVKYVSRVIDEHTTEEEIMERMFDAASLMFETYCERFEAINLEAIMEKLEEPNEEEP